MIINLYNFYVWSNEEIKTNKSRLIVRGRMPRHSRFIYLTIKCKIKFIEKKEQLKMIIVINLNGFIFGNLL